jgi:hypothetical protein
MVVPLPAPNVGQVPLTVGRSGGIVESVSLEPPEAVPPELLELAVLEPPELLEPECVPLDVPEELPVPELEALPLELEPELLPELEPLSLPPLEVAEPLLLPLPSSPVPWFSLPRLVELLPLPPHAGTQTTPRMATKAQDSESNLARKCELLPRRWGGVFAALVG